MTRLSGTKGDLEGDPALPYYQAGSERQLICRQHDAGSVEGIEVEVFERNDEEEPLLEEVGRS